MYLTLQSKYIELLNALKLNKIELYVVCKRLILVLKPHKAESERMEKYIPCTW